MLALLAPVALAQTASLNTAPAAYDERPQPSGQTVTLLTNGNVSAWEYQTFNNIPTTQYQTAYDDELGSKALFAHSQKGASGYVLQTSIDLQKTPWLHFQWRIDQMETGFDERSKAGDDFALRLYFITRSGLRYKSLSVVGSQAAMHTTWQSPYSGLLYDLHIYSLGNKKTRGKWGKTTINLAQLWQDIFDESAPILNAAGLMTDGDSAGAEMRARYGNIIFSNSSAPPFAIVE
ncbi:DUF3047 domain-containing protein [Candidatus Persebacteraceae bacterium Df01]|uniref:DUF3047 domain-containing protein n=1 Tax=Candidatus Doriopsillibacter californiensis TaxID=2970740 RepID=A0ABT7QJH3_9GAMM|nr:DUF3047 domain-containing protein [Candidatus Persebacteraceae bacterium Df01]